MWILCQMPGASELEIGKGMTVLVAFLAVFWLCRQIYLSFFPPRRRRSDEFVTHSELETAMEDVKKDIETAIKGLEIKILEYRDSTGTEFNSIKEQYRDLREYTSRSTHELRNGLQSLMLKMERVAVTLEQAELLPRGWRTSHIPPNLQDIPTLDPTPPKRKSTAELDD